MRPSAIAASLFILTIGASARAHIALDEPPKRVAAMKMPPCGGAGARSVMPAVFAPGQKVTVKWHETVVHPGFFRIALSMDGTTFPADPTDPPAPVMAPVLAIIPKVAGTTAYSSDITLPTTPCETCTIQVIQYMEMHTPPPYYYQCADIAIRVGAGGAANDGQGGVASGGTANGGAANGGQGGVANGGVANGGQSGAANGGTANGGQATVNGGEAGSASAIGPDASPGGADDTHDSGSCALTPRRGPGWSSWLALIAAVKVVHSVRARTAKRQR
ncbi:MAG TPA: SCE4755 family polysaccharide monooxygenase-like protein [Polyangiaceae bacterium]|nr:SCE4755 family polysaccharide monooxygenase-like protein [Polyangiaceae bacterium]